MLSFFKKKKAAASGESEAAVTNNDTTTTTEPITEKPSKEKKAPKEKPPKKPKASKKNNGPTKTPQEKSQLAQDLGIRISSPYGYYPEDVDPIIIKLQNEVASLTKENKKFSEENDKLNKNLKAVSGELAKIKMQVSLMEVAPLSMEDSLAGIDKISNITGQHPKNTPPISDLVSLLEDDGQAATIEDDAKPVKRPTFKLNNKRNGGNT